MPLLIKDLVVLVRDGCQLATTPQIFIETMAEKSNDPCTRGCAYYADSMCPAYRKHHSREKPLPSTIQRIEFVNALIARLEKQKHTVTRVMETITRIDGRFVNLWVVSNPRKNELVLRIGYKDKVQELGIADPDSVGSLSELVEKWMSLNPLDPNYDKELIR